MNNENILKFYKYQPMAEEKHFSFLQNYLEQKIWLTALSDFNDPFEGCFIPVFPPKLFLEDSEKFVWY